MTIYFFFAACIALILYSQGHPSSHAIIPWHLLFFCPPPKVVAHLGILGTCNRKSTQGFLSFIVSPHSLKSLPSNRGYIRIFSKSNVNCHFPYFHSFHNKQLDLDDLFNIRLRYYLISVM